MWWVVVFYNWFVSHELLHKNLLRNLFISLNRKWLLRIDWWRLLVLHWRLLVREHSSDLFDFLFNFGRGWLNKEIFLIFDLTLKLGDPSPELICVQSLLRFEFTQIGYYCCQNLWIDCVGFPFVEEKGSFFGVKFVCFGTYCVEMEEIFEHACAEESEADWKYFALEGMAVLHSTHLQSYDVFRWKIALFVIKCFVEICVLFGPAEGAADFCLSLYIQKHIMRSYVAYFASCFLLDLLLGCRQNK